MDDGLLPAAQTSSSASPKKRKRVTIPMPPLAAVVLVIVLCGLSFAGGMAYQKGHTKSTADQPAGGFAAGGAGRARRSGGAGQVTAVSASSITVDDQRSGTSKTYAITSSTAITDNGQTVAASDIKTGDTVLVTTDSSTSQTATRILVNPSFGGGFGGGAGQEGPDDSGSPSTQ